MTCITPSPVHDTFAIGYSDGSIKLWAQNTCIVTFNGHGGIVTCLSFNSDGTRLASGSKDTDIILWDVLEEVGLFRLRGHKNQITNLKFLSTNGSNHLVSSSADSLLKVWDLDTKYCVESLIAHRNEVWSMDIDPSEQHIYTCAVDSEVKVWSLNTLILVDTLKPDGEPLRSIAYVGSFFRIGKERSVMLKIHPSNKFIIVQGAEKSMDVFKILDEEEMKKKQNRRNKRQKEKGTQETDLSPMDAYSFVTTIRTQAKLRSFDVAPTLATDGSFNICANLTNNCIEQYVTNLPSKEEPTRLLTSIDQAGHGSDVRVLSLSSDDEMLMSGASST